MLWDVWSESGVIKPAYIFWICSKLCHTSYFSPWCMHHIINSLQNGQLVRKFSVYAIEEFVSAPLTPKSLIFKARYKNHLAWTSCTYSYHSLLPENAAYYPARQCFVWFRGFFGWEGGHEEILTYSTTQHCFFFIKTMFEFKCAQIHNDYYC